VCTKRYQSTYTTFLSSTKACECAHAPAHAWSPRARRHSSVTRYYWSWGNEKLLKQPNNQRPIACITETRVPVDLRLTSSPLPKNKNHLPARRRPRAAAMEGRSLLAAHIAPPPPLATPRPGDDTDAAGRKAVNYTDSD
jgi:hypothetical protein